MKGDLRCIEGRLFRHDPQWDDPDLETDIGACPDCSGDGCDDSDEPVQKFGPSEAWIRNAILDILKKPTMLDSRIKPNKGESQNG